MTTPLTTPDVDAGYSVDRCLADAGARVADEYLRVMEQGEERLEAQRREDPETFVSGQPFIRSEDGVASGVVVREDNDSRKVTFEEHVDEGISSSAHRLDVFGGDSVEYDHGVFVEGDFVVGEYLAERWE